MALTIGFTALLAARRIGCQRTVKFGQLLANRLVGIDQRIVDMRAHGFLLGSPKLLASELERLGDSLQQAT